MDWMNRKTWTAIALLVLAAAAIYAFALQRGEEGARAAAFAALSWRSAPATPPSVMPPTTAAIFEMTIVARTTRHQLKSVRTNVDSYPS